MRATVSALFLISFLAGLVAYFIGLKTGCFITEENTKVVYMASMAVYATYLCVPAYGYAYQFNQAGMGAIIAFFIVGIFCNLGLLNKAPYQNMIEFLGLFIALTCVILISGRKHGVLTN